MHVCALHSYVDVFGVPPQTLMAISALARGMFVCNETLWAIQVRSTII